MFLKEINKFIKYVYERTVFDNPFITLVSIACVTIFLISFAPQFRLDASSESLSLENDQDLKYYRSIKSKYGSDEFLVITFTPKKDLFSLETLHRLESLRNRLIEVENIKSIISILDVPLINSPPVSIEELSKNTPNFINKNVDITLARDELLSSPLYKDLLISSDAKTTALLISFKPDIQLQNLIKHREELYQKNIKLDHVEREYKLRNKIYQDMQSQDIHSIRLILADFSKDGTFYIGGVPMIVADSIDYIQKDLWVFGGLVLGLLIILLYTIFRKAVWVMLTMTTCFCVGIGMIGFLGLMNWPVTIVSANFISLLLIFTLSFCVHQIVKYNEVCRSARKLDQRELVRETVFDISVPCFYMSFTTVIGFLSLIVSDIKPVIDFGWMMAIGITFSFMISFTLFPSALLLIKPSLPKDNFDYTRHITNFFYKTIRNHGKLILFGFCILIIFSIIGMRSIYVQNSFINYYKKDTEIYQGMMIIDEKLGGTTPLDIVIDAPKSFIEFQQEEIEFLKTNDLYIDANTPKIIDGYWFNEVLFKDVQKIHNYLEALPEVGKVLSFHTTALMMHDLDEEKLLDRMYMGVLYNKMPSSVREILFSPYISDDGNQLRFSLRVYESQKDLNRERLLKQIHSDLVNNFGLNDDQVHVSGMLVLYNNVLQTLFRSQILTIGAVFITMLGIFWLIFRSFKIALVAIIPNITIVTVVLGLMGWLNIPLDIMTITIAAICFGMADDDTIHYIHRFMEEYKHSGNYWEAIKKSHNTIGRAMYYTTITIMLGFSIMAFSNFVPTIYFGLLTGFSMMVALLCDLMLLPLLIILFKPMGREKIS